MQDRYTGDIGDYVKLALLRALLPGRRLGVAWWLVPDEAHNADGKHLGYLDRPTEWRSLDPALFDGLRSIIQTGRRQVAALEASGLLPGATFAADVLRLREAPSAERAQQREDWFRGIERTLQDADLVFVDPDNGFEPTGFDVKKPESGKSVTFAELTRLRRPGRTLLVYHHHTRHKGGHFEELRYLGRKLRDRTDFAIAGALRSSRGTARAFFLLDANPQDIERIERFAHVWGPHCVWFSAESLLVGEGR